MKYVYVLVSSGNDLYCEQCLMSVFSLRSYMKDADITILSDAQTTRLLEEKKSALIKYATSVVPVDFPEKASGVVRSRILKTTIPEHIKGDFLFIDCDTIVCGDLFEIERFDFPVAGVLDGHALLNEHIHRDYFLAREKRAGFSGTARQGFHINSGVILCRDCEESRKFFSLWHELWTQNYEKFHDHHDQGPFNEAFFKSGLGKALLPGEWNCQPSHGGLAFLGDAKIIHYFSSEFSGKHYMPYYKLADKALQTRIKENGTIPDDIQEMILNPKFQFTHVHLVSDQRIVNIMQSPLTFTLADMKTKLPWLFRFFEAQAAFLRRLGKRLKGK